MTATTPRTVEQVAEHFGVPGTVLAWIHAGELAAVNVSRDRGSRRPHSVSRISGRVRGYTTNGTGAPVRGDGNGQMT